MRRRELLVFIAAAAAFPRGASAQPATVPVIGFLNIASPEGWVPWLTAFRRGLAETGFVEGETVAIEYRWALGRPERLPALAAELVGRRVVVLVATGGDAVARAAVAATGTIPIVFTVGSDPVGSGVVASLNRPGGNATGISLLTTALSAKRLELLRELLPKTVTICVLVNPVGFNTPIVLRDAETATAALGQHLQVLRAGTVGELDAAFATLAERRPDAIMVAADGFFSDQRNHIAMLAARSAIPAIYEWREYVEAGGLMSYGPSLTDAYRQAGLYVGRILKGAKPGDLPVQQPTTFELTINARTAKALGLEIPPAFLARVDEVIE